MEEEDKLLQEFLKGADWEKNRIRIIIEYILNKNSDIDGVDYKQAYEDMEDLESYLCE